MKKKTPKNKAWRDSDKPPQAYGKENEFLTRGQVSFPKLFNFDGTFGSLQQWGFSLYVKREPFVRDPAFVRDSGLSQEAFFSPRMHYIQL